MGRRHIQVREGDGSVPPAAEQTKRKVVTLEQLYTAIEWLNSNEGEGGEGEACKAVAKMLGDEAERREVAGLDRALIRKCLADNPNATRSQVVAALKRIKAADEQKEAYEKLGLPLPGPKKDIPVSEEEST